MPQRPAIASMSLGRAVVHSLPNKLDQAAKYGFEGIELYFEDLEYFARERCCSSSEPDASQLRDAATAIRKLCAERNLTIINLQPFMHYEGLIDRQRHAQRIEEMKLWIELAQELGTDLIQVPSSFLPADQITDDIDVIVSDLQEIADLGLQQSPSMRFAYESLAWGTYVDTWEKCYDIVQRVDRPNFGICLDTFNIAARVFADPSSPSGENENAHRDMAASIQRLGNIDKEKVFFVQLVDGERLSRPLVEGHEFYNAEQPARLSWSRNCRLFYGEEQYGGYLPVKEIAKAFLDDIAFEGWWSMELFNRCMWEEDPSMPEQLAKRGIDSWERMKHDLLMVEGAHLGVMVPANKDIDMKRGPKVSVKEVGVSDRHHMSVL